MIISGTIELDPAAHAATTAALRSRLEHLEERRRTAELSIDRVLATWQGDAAASFGARWGEWNSGALAVVDQLVGAIEALEDVRRDVTGVDQDCGRSSVRLAGRLA